MGDLERRMVELEGRVRRLQRALVGVACAAAIVVVACKDPPPPPITELKIGGVTLNGDGLRMEGPKGTLTAGVTGIRLGRPDGHALITPYAMFVASDKFYAGMLATSASSEIGVQAYGPDPGPNHAPPVIGSARLTLELDRPRLVVKDASGKATTFPPWE